MAEWTSAAKNKKSQVRRCEETLSDIFEPTTGVQSVDGPDPRALARRMTTLKALAGKSGYFNVSTLEQALRCVELAAMPLLAFALLALGGWAAAAGAIVLAIHYPRTGYLGHDLAHNHWGPRNDAKPRFMLRAVALFQGFGSTWWVEKHELHHAFPNGCRVSEGGILTPIDGDIDSAPWLVWDKSLAEYNAKARETAWSKFLALAMPRLQVPLFFPLLSLARFNWSSQSIEIAARKEKFLEAALCAAHWVLGLALALFLTPGPAWTGLVWFLVAQLMGGFLLGIVFVLNHTGMEVYDASKAGGFYDRQARATRNTPSSRFFDWITGGLNSQIEHHMFPTMARRNLPKMRALTKSAMLECGYAYEELKNREALRAVMSALGDAARA
jgi:fatty acid desaturase